MSHKASWNRIGISFEMAVRWLEWFVKGEISCEDLFRKLNAKIEVEIDLFCGNYRDIQGRYIRKVTGKDGFYIIEVAEPLPRLCLRCNDRQCLVRN